ncbi:hypothetical protein [Vibrio brasiliensis]|uniref:hypothetical protein n=1 Tax=Vibrio brasiliensis TaxID=170652 RepID=UPI001EFD4FD3|nr:hypothetical protein [Vibrio brasiliensis]MCG9724502.1 hypothetical protein [Vibrio brasiliensis]
MRLILTMLSILTLMASANAEQVDCQPRASYGDLLSNSVKESIIYSVTMRTSTLVKTGAYNLYNEDFKTNLASNLDYINEIAIPEHEDGFLAYAKALMQENGGKCYGLVNMTHDVKVDGDNIYLFSFGDIYTTK